MPHATDDATRFILDSDGDSHQSFEKRLVEAVFWASIVALAGLVLVPHLIVAGILIRLVF